MKARWALVVLGALAQCACATEYRARPSADVCSGPGYSEERIGRGEYRILYVGPTNFFGGVVGAAKRRASELCANGYSVQSTTTDGFLCPGNRMWGMKGVPASELEVACNGNGS